MEKKHLSFLLRATIVLIMLVSAILVYPSLPDLIPLHWDFDGQVDRYGSKLWGVWLMPVVALIFLFLFAFFPKLSSKKDNVKYFEPVWSLFQTIFIAFLAYFYAIILRSAVNPDTQGAEVVTLIFLGVGVLFVISGWVMPQLRPDHPIHAGSAEEKTIMKRTHYLAGKMFMLAGIPFLLLTWLTDQFFFVFFGVLILVVLIPILYLHMLFHDEA